MCVIIHKPAGFKIDNETLSLCYDANPDGFGVSYYDADKRLHVHKGLLDDDQIRQFVRKLDMGLEIVFHFRITTHGKTNKRNCHPFKIRTICGEQFALIHNGILPLPQSDMPNPDKSDTHHFADWLGDWSLAEIRQTLPDFEKWHGTGNRLAWHFVDGVQRTGTWHEVDGLFFSNTHWKRTAVDWYVPPKRYRESSTSYAKQWDKVFSTDRLCEYCSYETVPHDSRFPVCDDCASIIIESAIADVANDSRYADETDDYR